MTHPRLQRAVKLAQNPEIEALRSMEFKNEAPPVPFDQYCTLVEMLVAASSSRTEIEEALGIDTDILLEAVVELARFMHATRGNPQVEVLGTWSQVEHAAQPKLPGFINAVTVPSSKRKVTPAPETKAKKGTAKAAIVGIVVPDGFSRQELHRDVESSLTAIVALQPSNDDVKRFIQRHYQRTQQPLSFEMLCAVWMFARLDRLSGLHNVASASSFIHNCVQAWDTLEVTRRDAMDALVTLETATDSTELHIAASKLLPLWEAEARDLQRLLEISGPESAAFERARAWLTRRVSVGQLVVDSVADLSEGQVRRIAMLVGLDTEVISRNEESHIRQHLVRLKLDRDAEQLIPIGVVAVRAGMEEEFFHACRLRAAGDEKWDAPLAQLLAR